MEFRRRNFHKMRKYEKAGSGENEDNFEDLLVFGYPCTIFRDDERALWVENGSHLMVSPSDEKLTIDRYDCRLLLSNVKQFECNGSSSTKSCLSNSDDGFCEAENLEQVLCDEERYRDLKEPESGESENVLNSEQTDSAKAAAIPYDYGTNENKSDEEISSEEEDPYFAPPELRVPPDLAIPSTLTQNFIIEKTATFISSQGPQMEIIINAKQKANKLFRFLDYDNSLHKFYKHVLKMIREKKYTPNLDNPVRTKKPKKPKIIKKAESDESDDDSGGHYLHPSLMAATGSSSKKDSASSSPVSWPSTSEHPVSTYKLGQGDDVYSELYNRLSIFMPPKQEPEEILQPIVTSTDDGTFLNQYTVSGDPFSGQHPDANTWQSASNSGSVVPPPPDLQPVIDRLAEYVARNGSDFETVVRSRRDERFHFVEPTNVYYPYYCSKIHWYQYEHYMSTFYHGGGEGAVGLPPESHHRMQISKSSSELAELEKIDKIVSRKPIKPLIDHPWCTPGGGTISNDASSSGRKSTEPKPFEKSKGVTISFSLKSTKEKQDPVVLVAKSKIGEQNEGGEMSVGETTESPKPVDVNEEPNGDLLTETTENDNAVVADSVTYEMSPNRTAEVVHDFFVDNVLSVDSVDNKPEEPLMSTDTECDIDLLDSSVTTVAPSREQTPGTSSTVLQNARLLKARLFMDSLKQRSTTVMTSSMPPQQNVGEKSSRAESKFSTEVDRHKTSSSERRHHKRHRKRRSRSRSNKRSRRSRSRS